MRKHTGARLIDALRAPGLVASWNARTWTDVMSLARRELMLGHLAAVLEAAHITPPKRVQANLTDALRDTFHNARRNRQEAERLQGLLAPLNCPVLVLKGTAYTMGNIEAGRGRLAGDIDILVPRERLDEVEAVLLTSGWELQKTDPYDMHYYRQWMHELPPMQHRERGTNLDLHHTILPLTARLRPAASAMVAAAVPLGTTGLLQLCPADQVLHSAVHLFYDGDLTGGLRNLHDLHRLLGEYGDVDGFWQSLAERTQLHGLGRPMFYALRYCERFFGTSCPPPLRGRIRRLSRPSRLSRSWRGGQGMKHPPLSVTLSAEEALSSTISPARGERGERDHSTPNPLTLALMDTLITTRLTRVETGPHSLIVRTATLMLYIRSHWLKMPPKMLVRHLWVKWRRGMREG